MKVANKRMGKRDKYERRASMKIKTVALLCRIAPDSGRLNVRKGNPDLT